MKSDSHHRGLVQRFRQQWRQIAPHTAGPLLVGFSGGTDSLALALIAREVIDPERLLLVHVDHNLRSNSIAEASHAQNLARTLGLPLQSERIGWPSGRPTSDVEARARAERFAVFQRIADTKGADTVALAHHQRDQAETILLHLLRGAGLTGLAGMAPLGSFPDSCLRIWRPLLEESPAALADEVERSGLVPNLDPTNSEQEFDRNWIRLQLLPLIRTRFPHAEQSIARLGEVLRPDLEFLQSEVGETYASCLEGEQLAIGSLSTTPVAIQRGVIRRWLLDQGVEEPTYERTEAVRQLVGRPQRNLRIEAGSGVTVGVISGMLLSVDESGSESQERG